jgi:hypothetical protein
MLEQGFGDATIEVYTGLLAARLDRVCSNWMTGQGNIHLIHGLAIGFSLLFTLSAEPGLLKTGRYGLRSTIQSELDLKLTRLSASRRRNRPVHLALVEPHALLKNNRSVV